MGLGRNAVDDENSIFVQNARKVQLTDELEIHCKTSDAAETLRAHLAELDATIATLRTELTACLNAAPKPAKRAPQKVQG